jgi:hypothetical protein
MKTATTYGWAGVFSALALTVGAAGLSQAESHERRLKLEGTWLVQVTRRDCDTDADVESFQAMNGFSSAGSLVEFGTTPAVTPAMRTPGLGNWRRTGPRQFRAVFSLFFLPDGVNVGSLHRIERVITMTSWNRFSADARVKILDPTGAVVLATGCASETARRIS